MQNSVHIYHRNVSTCWQYNDTSYLFLNEIKFYFRLHYCEGRLLPVWNLFITFLDFVEKLSVCDHTKVQLFSRGNQIGVRYDSPPLGFSHTSDWWGLKRIFVCTFNLSSLVIFKLTPVQCNIMQRQQWNHTKLLSSVTKFNSRALRSYFLNTVFFQLANVNLHVGNVYCE